MAVSKVVYKSSANATPVVWMDSTPATATAADIISPKTAMLANGVVTTGTGSGGASNIVTGTFTASSTEQGSAKTITLPYTGSGYPVMGIIYPSGGGWVSGSSLASLAQKSVIIMVSFAKSDFSLTPDYSANEQKNYMEMTTYFKYSDSDATSTSAGRGHAQRNYRDTNASNTYVDCIRFRSATSLSVYIASTGYGFKDGVEYAYQIVYSS